MRKRGADCPTALSQLLCGWGQDRSLTGTAPQIKESRLESLSNKSRDSPCPAQEGATPNLSRDLLRRKLRSPDLLPKERRQYANAEAPCGENGEWGTLRHRRRQRRLLGLRENPLTQPKVHIQGGEGPGAGAEK